MTSESTYCKHCGVKILQHNTGWGVRWRHDDGSFHGRAWCMITVAEPDDE